MRDDEITKALKKLKQLDPNALQEAHDEMIDGFDEQGRPTAEGNASFELDDKLFKVPFKKLRETLHGRDTVSSQPAKEVFAGRIPRSVGSYDERGFYQVNPEPDPEYYWDKNYNYEYMNPESKKKKVLGKIKK